MTDMLTPGRVPEGGPAPLIPAATVVPLRDTAEGLEVLMLRRNRSLRAFGGAWVFPGGKVEDGDAPGAEARERARAAAARETMEECGLSLAPDRLAAWSLWIPPASERRRFETWFFLADTEETPVVIDQSEIHDSRWVRPADIVAAVPDPDFQLVPPTYVTLCELQACADVDSALALARSRVPPRFETQMHKREGGLALCWEGDAAWDMGDFDAAGARRRLWAGEAGWRFECDVPPEERGSES